MCTLTAISLDCIDNEGALLGSASPSLSLRYLRRAISQYHGCTNCTWSYFVFHWQVVKYMRTAYGLSQLTYISHEGENRVNVMTANGKTKSSQLHQLISISIGAWCQSWWCSWNLCKPFIRAELLTVKASAWAMLANWKTSVHSFTTKLNFHTAIVHLSQCTMGIVAVQSKSCTPLKSDGLVHCSL